MHCICFRKPTETEWSELVAETELEGVHFFAADASVYDWLLSKGCKVERIHMPNRRKAKLELHALMHEFAHHDTSEHQGSILKRLSVDDVFYPWYLVRRQLNGVTISTFEEYQVVNKLLSSLTEEAYVYSKSALFQVALGDGVKVFGPGAKEVGKKRPISDLVFYFSVLLVRALKGLFSRFPTDRHVYLYGSFAKQNLFDLGGTHLMQGDPIFQYLHDEISTRKSFTTVSVYKNVGLKSYPNWFTSITKPRYAKSHVFFEWFILKALLRSKSRKRINSFKRRLEENKEVRYEHGFYHYLNQQTSRQKIQLLLAAVKYEAGLLMMDAMKPKTIGGDGEWTFAKYPILMAAKRCKVPTFGIQHGIISDQNMDYTFFSSDAALGPFVDRTMVWGEGAIDRLSNRSVYPRNTLHITGQVRTDVIESLSNHRPTFLLPNWVENDKVVLYASQYLPRSVDMRDRLIRDVLRLQKEVDGLRVVVKPHPREMGELQVYEEIAKELGVKLELSTEDLYGLISISDLVITFYSTVGTEALYFGKDLLVLDYDRVDGSGYISEGVAHHCDSFDALKDKVSRFYSSELEDKTAQREAYVSRIAHSIDGKTRFRIVDAITDLSRAEE